MTLTTKLQQLNTAWTNLNTKVKNKLQTLQQQLTSANTNLNTKTTQLNETNHKLELQVKENKANEKVLEQLLKEFKDLEESL